MGPKKLRKAKTPKQLSRDSQPTREFYRDNEHLGSETRATELKIGPGFIQNEFRLNVAKYVCGFINSQENGKLLIGVNDEGNVCGCDCNHEQEGSLRRDVNEAVKDLAPPVLPKDYSVRFVPVCTGNDDPKGNYSVIEIMVQGANMEVKDQLYRYRQADVFMWRDGSIQELNANESHELMSRRYESEIVQHKKDKHKWRVLFFKKQNEFRPMAEKLKLKKNELDKKDMDLQRLKSSVDHVADEIRQLKDENYRLRQNSQRSVAKGSDEVDERLAETETLEVPGAKIKKQKSTACVIS